MKKKRVLNFTMLYENESLKEYLEEMALRGWKLVRIGTFLQFEACSPHPIRYCVEVMEKASAFASNQTPALREYRSFCQEAGWEYIGTNGFQHVFCTEDPAALPVETDVSERFERILRASWGNNRSILLCFGLLILLNLYNSFQAGSLFSPGGFACLLLAGAGLWYTGNFFIWKRQAKRSLQADGTLPVRNWKKLRLKEWCALGILYLSLIVYLAVWFLDFSSEDVLSSAAPFLILYLVIFLSSLFLFQKLLRWLREKKSYRTGINLLIYWGIALVLFGLIIAFGLIFLLR